MNKAFRSVLLSLLLCFLTLGVAWGQTSQDLPADAQFTDNFGVDSINLQNLDVVVNAPILSKPGAIPFSVGFEALSNCAVVAVGTPPSLTKYAQCGTNLQKVHAQNVSAFAAVSPSDTWSLSGQVSGAQFACTADANAPTQKYQLLKLNGPGGTTYYLPSADTITVETGGSSCGTTLNDYTVNGGMHVVATNTLAGSGQPALTSVTSPDGKVWSQGTGFHKVVDPFNNSIQNNVGASNNWVDTLADTAVTQVSATDYQYQDTGSTNRDITLTLGSSQTVKTAFGCSSINDTSFSGTPVTSINYPDGSDIGLAYEAITGGITGRISQITLRTGGTVGYTYGTIDCTTFYPGSVSRTTADGTTTYTIATITGGSTTTKLDPGKNETIWTFMGTPGSNTSPVVLTQVQVFKNTGTVGSPSYPANANQTALICYNNNTTNCATTAPTYPIQYKDVYVTLDGKSTSSRTKYTYDTFSCGTSQTCSYGNVTEIDRYPFVATVGSGTIDNKTVITYGSWNGSSCASVGSSIVNLPCEVKTTDGGGTKVLSDVRHTYGTKGFETTTSVWSGSQWFATRVALANSNGTPQYIRNSLGTQTNYSYAATGSGGCNAMLPTGTSVTVNSVTMTTSATWDCNMGKLLTSTDANSNQSTFTYDLLGRPHTQTDPGGAYTLTENYPSATTETVGDGTYFTTTYTVDGLSRPIRSQTTDGASYDTVSLAYGFTAGSNRYWEIKSSQPCITTLNADCTLNHFTDIDPEGRVYTTSTTSNETVTHNFTQNDIADQLSPAPSGENTKTTQTEVDGLGRVTSICALQATGGTSCGQFDGHSGILTTVSYSYSAGGVTTTSTRGSQSHTTFTDQLGRLKSFSLPESGTTTNYYDVSGNCSGDVASTGNLTCSVDNAAKQTVYAYDGLNRLTDTNTNSGAGPCRRYRYDVSGNGLYTAPTGYAGSNAKGRIVEAATDDCTWPASQAHMITDEWFAYDADGRVTDVWETTPNSSGWYHTQLSYYANGQPYVLSGVPGKSSYTFGLDSNGRLDTSTYGTTAVATNVTYNGAGQPTEVDLGSGSDKDLFPRDPNTGLMMGWTYNVGANSQTAVLTWNGNRTLKKLAITDSIYSGGTQTCNYNPTDHAGTGYDDVGRLVGAYCGASWNHTYAYDQYDNFSKSGTTSWSPGYSATTNHITGASYDSDGQVTYDLNNSYAWDGYHKMITANSGSSLGSCGAAGVTCITYDAFGRPVEKNVGGTITETLYSPIGLTGIMSGQTTNSFRVPIPGMGIFRSGANNAIYHQDWLGNVRVQNNLADALIKDNAYDPYGEKYFSSGGTDFIFAGNFSDLFSGLYDTPNRELDVASGSRWLSPDPARASWNAYAYPTNPNSMTDPSGLCPNCMPEPGQRQGAMFATNSGDPFDSDNQYYNQFFLSGQQISNYYTQNTDFTETSWLSGGGKPQDSVVVNVVGTMSNGTQYVNLFTGYPVGNGLLTSTPGHYKEIPGILKHNRHLLLNLTNWYYSTKGLKWTSEGGPIDFLDPAWSQLETNAPIPPGSVVQVNPVTYLYDATGTGTELANVTAEVEGAAEVAGEAAGSGAVWVFAPIVPAAIMLMPGDFGQPPSGPCDGCITFGH